MSTIKHASCVVLIRRIWSCVDGRGAIFSLAELWSIRGIVNWPMDGWSIRGMMNCPMDASEGASWLGHGAHAGSCKREYCMHACKEKAKRCMHAVITARSSLAVALPQYLLLLQQILPWSVRSGRGDLKTRTEVVVKIKQTKIVFVLNSPRQKREYQYKV